MIGHGGLCVFTRVLATKTAKSEALRSILTDWRAQDVRMDWIRRALQILTDVEGVERAGVWLEPEPGTEDRSDSDVLQGEIWDRDGGSILKVSSRISIDVLPPRELLKQGQSAEYQSTWRDGEWTLGPLLGLKSALWAPVGQEESLRGLVLIGGRKRLHPKAKACAERIATELACLLDWSDEQRFSRQRQAQAERLASLGERAIGIVHELTNPITTILGNAQRLVLRTPPFGQNPQARLILEEAERATAILRQLLHGSSDPQSARQRISVRDLVERTATLQNSAMAGSKIELRLDFAPRLPSIAGDFAQLQQTLLNLLQNARQAIEQSGQGRTIGLRAGLDGAGVQLEVWDDGPGISPAIRERIYDPFFTTKAQRNCTGLGLSIARGFVRRNGGTITYLSRSEGGSRFVVELPFPGDAVVEHEQTDVQRYFQTRILQSVEPIRETNGATIRSRATRVLVLEDEPTVAALIAEVLRQEGMSVDVFLNGHSALERIEREPYDLLICDLKMPGVDGLSLYRMLLERRHSLRKRALFVTGDVIATSTREFLAQHHLPYVAKPFRIAELSRAVKRLLSGFTTAKNRPTETSSNHAAGER